MKKSNFGILFFFLLLLFSCSKDPVATCTDGIQNGTEIGIDCGGSCQACDILGCTNPAAHNYNPNATQNDGSCQTCTDGIQNGPETGVDCGGTCLPCTLGGCTNPNAHNFNPAATQDDGSCQTCDDGILNGDEQGVDCGGVLCDACPSLGDPGPAGGLIFYDKGSFSDGWRYLEYGIEIQGGDKQWGCRTSNNTSFLLGTGFNNTANVVNNYNTNNCSQSPDAFLVCSNLARNGFSDWYLPSVNELQELYPYRTQLGLGDKRYWSSSELDASIAYVVDYGGEANGVPYSYTWAKTPVNGQQGLSAVVAIRRF